MYVLAVGWALHILLWQECATEGLSSFYFGNLCAWGNDAASEVITEARQLLVENYSFYFGRCLTVPWKAQYGGGIIKNPEFDHGLRGWSTFGNGKVAHRSSGTERNNYIVSYDRNQPHDSFSQKLFLQKDKLYSFSAWVQVNEGSAPVTAVFKTSTGFTHAGATIAKSGCWSMMKGGLTVDVSGRAELFFESNNTVAEIWVDSVSLQSFTQEEWKSHQKENIDKERKKKTRIRAVDRNLNPLVGAQVSIQQVRPGFPFGAAIDQNILNNQAYQNWFTSRFTVTVFENEMKWYSTEPISGQENYSVPDSMVAFCASHKISIRGHNILWDDPKYQPSWVGSLPSGQLRDAVNRRIESVVKRYAGRVIHWDVLNENLHFSFFETKLDANASEEVFQRAYQYDSNAIMFMNEYNTLEVPSDAAVVPTKYLQKLQEIRSYPGNSGKTGIGLESHFDQPNIPYMRSSLDTLGAAGVPIWLTEVDVGNIENQSGYLEQILSEGYSHPKVSGIILWAAWKPQGCYRMCLTDNNFHNLPTGVVVDKLLAEWKSNHQAITNKDGFVEVNLFHGDYKVTITHPSTNSSSDHNINLDNDGSEETILLQLKV